MRHAIFRWSVALLFVLTAVSANAQKVDPRSNISGPSTPTGLRLSCSASNVGEPFTNTAVTPNEHYKCGSDGWEKQGNNYPGITVDSSNRTSVNASVNSQINVLSYGAKGDCNTDDHDAIIAAQTAAIAMAVGTNGTPGVLYFPKPPGGCYLTSAIQWAGVSMIGQPSGSGTASPAAYGVTIKGKPGQDILHVPDPTTSTFKWYGSWTLRDISFVVDDTTKPTFAHRWPGRWFDDGAMTSGSNFFATSNGEIGCGDIGEAIQVNGAGANGGNLVTTIASVSPCWANSFNSSVRNFQIVTLAANASTTVTNAHSYISLLGEPVTQIIGNCAIGMDDKDGKRANWVNPSQSIGSISSSIENVSFNVTGGNWYNPVCAIYTQGAHILYALRVKNFGIYSSSYGVVQGTSELNSYYASSSGDFEHWQHGFIMNSVPWISYNGINNTLDDIELTVNAGPQILGVSNNAADIQSHWHINLPEMESPNRPTTYGMRVTGWGHTFGNTSFSAVGMTGVLDTQYSTGDLGPSGGNLLVYGSNNNISAPNGSVTESGIGNIVTAPGYVNSVGLPADRVMTMIPSKDRPDLLGGFYPDFLSDGNPFVAYKHADLWLWPQDEAVASKPYSNSVIADAASITGFDMVWNAGANIDQWSQFPGAGATQSMVVGKNIPASPITVYALMKCQTVSSTFRFHITTSGGYVGGSNTVTCGTKLAPAVVHADLTGQTGNVRFNNDSSAGSNKAWVAWFYVQPQQGLNGIPGVGAGAGIPSGPTTSTANDLVIYADGAATQADASTGKSTIGTSKTMGNGVPMFLFNNGYAAGNGQYDTFIQLFAPNAGAGSHIQGPTFGYANSANNEVHMQLDFSGAGSTSNVVSLISYLTTMYTCNLSAGTCSFPHAVSLARGSTMNSQTIATTNQLPLSGTSNSIGGSRLMAGQAATGSVSITGATTSMACVASPAGGNDPGDSFVPKCRVSAAGIATVSVVATAAGTPTASKYNVRVIQ